MSDRPTDFMDLKPVVMPGIKARGGAGAITMRKLDDDIETAPKQKKVDPTTRFSHTSMRKI